MSETSWTKVDAFFEDRIVAFDSVLGFLQLLALTQAARRILEVAR